jgi:cell division protein ZapA
MASIEVEIAGRKYSVACRDGEEAHLRSVAAIADKRARDAAEALGSLTETRQLLFTTLLLADDVQDMRSGGKGAPPPPAVDEGLAGALESLADRVEALARRLEAPSPLEEPR